MSIYQPEMIAFPERTGVVAVAVAVAVLAFSQIHGIARRPGGVNRPGVFQPQRIESKEIDRVGTGIVRDDGHSVVREVDGYGGGKVGRRGDVEDGGKGWRGRDRGERRGLFGGDGEDGADDDRIGVLDLHRGFGWFREQSDDKVL